MVLAVPIAIVVVMILLVRADIKAKKRNRFNKLSISDHEQIIAARHSLQQLDEELITTILPTLNDK